MADVPFHNCNRCGKRKRRRSAKRHRLCFRCMMTEAHERTATPPKPPSAESTGGG